MLMNGLARKRPAAAPPFRYIPYVRTAILVATYDQPRWLDLALRGWSRQSRRPDAVVVADDGSGPETAEVVGRWGAVHHPFTRPVPDWEDRFDEDPAHAIAHAYDLIGNGNELGGGSFRMHEPDLQARVFRVLELTEEEQRVKFGFLLDALAMGAPPHGGIAFGIDRMMMVLAREPNLRDTVAFPKNQAGLDPMTGAPTDVEEEQLRELGIRVLPPGP